MLSILIFIRMFQAEQKVPTDTKKFLVFVAEKIMKIVKNQDSEKLESGQKILTVLEQCYLDEKLPTFDNASIIMPKHL